MYDKLIANVNNIDTKGLALKTKYESELESKTPDTSGLVKKKQIIVRKLVKQKIK